MVRIKRREDIILSSRITNYYNPNYILIPFFLTDEILVKPKEKVKINSAIIRRKEEYLYSSISGYIGETECYNDQWYLKIYNDFKEDKINNKYQLDELIDNKKYNKLVIRAIDKEPYIRNYEYLLDRNLNDLLDIIDELRNYLKLKEVILLLCDNYVELINKINTIIGSYPNIVLRIVPSEYPVIINDYNDKDCLQYNLFECFNFHKLINEGIHLDTSYISVVGNALNKSSVVNSKKYVNIKELINDNFKIVDDNYQIIINGIISGDEKDNLDFCLNDDIHAVFIMKKEVTNSMDCINCGECVKHCPMHLNPIYIINHPKKKSSKDSLKKCLHCNTCSYVCPAKINLSKHLGGKNE